MGPILPRVITSQSTSTTQLYAHSLRLS
uniref:Uncharacterized protein n=1 Tax=Anguilla anguilla TaxID=7936 RepID=A0A0E9QAD7_ANGAN